MRESIRNLVTIAPPPEHPASVEWGLPGARLLPPDYRELVDIYGAGCFDGFLWLLVPGHANPNLDLYRQQEIRRGAIATLAEQGEPLPEWLASGALIPWATTDNGDTCYWHADPNEEPKDWVVGLNDSRSADWERYNIPASDFVLGVLTGNITSRIFPPDFPTGAPVFEPA